VQFFPDEYTRSGETMMQVKQKHVGASPSGLQYAEPEQDALESNEVFRTNRCPPSPRWMSGMKRLFDTPGDSQNSRVRSIASSRLVKFLVVGGIGVFVNLAVMALLIEVGYSRDWRASAIASAVAALHNYLLNNHWTFRDRRRNGRALVNGAFLYLPMAALGIAVTTVVYSILTQTRFRTNFGPSSFYLLGAQLISILFGTYLNYSLNRVFTWRLERDELQQRHAGNKEVALAGRQHETG
jgi:putative flippase GtrA